MLFQYMWPNYSTILPFEVYHGSFQSFLKTYATKEVAQRLLLPIAAVFSCLLIVISHATNNSTVITILCGSYCDGIRRKLFNLCYNRSSPTITLTIVAVLRDLMSSYATVNPTTVILTINSVVFRDMLLSYAASSSAMISTTQPGGYYGGRMLSYASTGPSIIPPPRGIFRDQALALFYPTSGSTVTVTITLYQYTNLPV